jgi:protein-S-isoprenylcysteine O-methyltransferase Ste14
MDGPTFFILATYAAQIIQVCFFAVPSAGSTIEILFKVKKNPIQADQHPSAAVIRSRLKMTMLISATLAVAATSLIPLISVVYPPIIKLLVPLMLRPTGPMKTVCILLLVSGNVLTYAAAGSLRAHVSFHTFGETSRLHTAGIYGCLRNPITVGLALIYAGFILALPSAVMLAGFILFWLNSAYRINMEEAYLQGVFGEQYAQYRHRVGKYFPKLWKMKSR